MARYTGPSCRLCRREGQKLFLKGDRCYSGKCALEKRSYPPGQHGQGRKKASNYGLQLREKQKCKRFYGLQETQFRNYFVKASAGRGITGETLLAMLETRLDNTVFRMGFASSRKEARQLVLHGHFTVNGKKVDIPSYSVKAGDIITPAWLTIDTDKLEGKVLSLPDRNMIDTPVEEQLIVELYSK